MSHALGQDKLSHHACVRWASTRAGRQFFCADFYELGEFQKTQEYLGDSPRKLAESTPLRASAFPGRRAVTWDAPRGFPAVFIAPAPRGLSLSTALEDSGRKKKKMLIIVLKEIGKKKKEKTIFKNLDKV